MNDSNRWWIFGAIGVIWFVVLVTSLNSPSLIFGDGPVDIKVAAIANWFWGLLGTLFLLRSTIFRRPHELGWGQDRAWPYVAVVVSVVWLIAMFVSSRVPNIDVGETISVPIAAMVAPAVAACLTLYVGEFLITGFAARSATGPTA